MTQSSDNIDQSATPETRIAGMRAEVVSASDVLINKTATDYRTYYTNNTAFALTAFDINLIFGQMIGIEDGKAVIEQGLKVIMSPLHAKIFLSVLGENLKQFEDRFGEIKLPEEVLKLATTR
jgi:hypothetical protein